LYFVNHALSPCPWQFLAEIIRSDYFFGVPNNTALFILVKVKKQRRFQFISKVMLTALKVEDISSGNSCMSTVFWWRYTRL